MARAETFNPETYIKPGVHSTGEKNLYLLISTVGHNARSWTFRYQWQGKTRVIGLGPLHTVSFNEAKVKALNLRRWILEGKDPKAELAKEKASAVPKLTFDQCAEQFIGAKKAEWSNPKHVKQWVATLATYGSPIIGSMPVDAVVTEHILKILNPIWTTKTETATRVRQRIESVLDWAKSKGQREGDNPAAWAGHLEHLLAKPGRIAKVKHHPSLPWRQIPAFIAALRERKGQAAKAIELLILCANRSIEVRGACWSEFDFEKNTWTIPAERMKAGVEHEVPLSPAALELLSDLPRHEGCDFLFPSRKNTMLSDMTLSKLVEGMNEPEVKWIDPSDGRAIVPHGFRSTFRVWAAEATTIPREVAEHALAHKLPDAVEAAYQRSTLPIQRARLMNEWAAWATSKPGSVVSLQKTEAA